MDTIDLQAIIENKKKDPETYKKWDEALKELYNGGIEEVAENEPLMIAEHDFMEYAQDLADDIGAIDGKQGWPLYCIDWAWAAKELRMDYTEVEVDGTTYLFRGY